MEKFSLEDMVKGWFVGDFEPTIIKSDQFEVAVKRYNAGDYENYHHHKIATELTVIIEGEVEMNGIHFKKNDIIKINANEITDFKCITDVTTVVVKTPSVKNDKY
jgi:hypothetical protein